MNRRSNTTIAAVLTTIAALAATAPAAPAAVFTFGSDLSAPANHSEARQADTAYWQAAFASGASPASPADGQITEVKLKGIALSDPKPGIPGGETIWHLQALRQQADGTFRILRTSQAFYLPTTGDPQQISTYAPTDFCINTGDVLAFNTVGGWDGIVNQTGPYPGGTPLQIFSTVPGASIWQFTGADRTNNGDVMRPNTLSGRAQELLMQLTVGTATDAVPHCPGGQYTPEQIAAAMGPPRIQKATIPKQRVTVSRKGTLTLALFCLPGSGPCVGHVTLLSRRGRRLAGGRYTIAPKATGKVALRLSPSAHASFRRSGQRLPAKVVSETAPGGPSKTSTFSVTLRRRGA